MTSGIPEIIGDELWTPEDVRITTGMIRAIQCKDKLLKALKQQLAQP